MGPSEDLWDRCGAITGCLEAATSGFVRCLRPGELRWDATDQAAGPTVEDEVASDGLYVEKSSAESRSKAWTSWFTQGQVASRCNKLRRPLRARRPATWRAQ